ncbi:MAG: BMP family ABC transporter substrate-binding protein [Clostridiales bacterium]|nr:BMP family ABC transporter substrate-binding protein [Clostridiales bacterium]
MALEHYDAALKAGKKDMQACIAAGGSGTLPVLDEILGDAEIRGEVPLGLQDIPVELIVGTRTAGRATSFAPNFMPILDEKTEFAMKWNNLCDIHINEGIRDPIVAYEYLNKYYILEGNKRVSVLKYFGATSIPGYVTRVIPAWKDTPEIRIYYEFLGFYNETSINYVEVTKEGSYREICRLTGHRKNVRWSLDDRIDFRSCYNIFADAFEDLGGDKLDSTTGDAFLSYLRLFGYDEMKHDTEAHFKENLKKLWAEFEITQSDADPEENTTVKLDPTPDYKKSIASQIISVSQAAVKTPIKIAFMYNSTIEESGWTYTHELGRIHVEEAFGGKVKTTVYEDIPEDGDKDLRAIEQAIDDGNTVIFTTSPIFLTSSIKAAADHPKVKILNCSVNSAHKYIRTYYARVFEAKLLNGVLAGIMTDTGKIGYIADYPIVSVPAAIDAFALGVKMVNPKAKIYLEWSTARENQGVNLTEKFYDQGITYISHLDTKVPRHPTREYGLYRVNGETPVNLASPVLDWGKFYERLIRNILRGTWNAEGKYDPGKALSYFWGMSSGVVDVIWSDAIPSETRNLLETMKHSIMRYDFNPFRGNLHTQDGVITAPPGGLNTSDIIAIDWLADNVIGSIPATADVVDSTKEVVRQEGVRRKEDE